MGTYHFCEALTLLARLIHRHNTTNLSWLGLGSGQLAALRVIHQIPGIGQAALTDRLGLHKSVVSRLIKGLIRAGYVVRTATPESPRRLGLWPTRHDFALRQCQESSYQEAETRLTAEFSTEELAHFRQFIHRAAGRMASAPTDFQIMDF